MTPTKDHQAQEYAEKKNRAMRKAWYEYRFGPICDGDDWENDPVKPSDNFEKGFMAGVSFREQSMWRSLKEERPQKNGDYLICTEYGEIEIAFWEDNYWLGNDSYPVIATHWRELPSLPDTNTEKR